MSVMMQDLCVLCVCAGVRTVFVLCVACVAMPPQLMSTVYINIIIHVPQC